jgi:CubicO group peptidase (beta-lactamase class C family)
MKLIRSFLFISIIISLLMPNSCSTKPSDSTAASGAKLLDSLLSAAVDNGEIPGAVAYIKLGGEKVYHKAFGYSQLETGEVLKRDDIFMMASMTKGLTAVAVLQLVEQGLLFLDENLADYIPAFRNPQILEEIHEDSSFTARPATGEITIRQLLTHTSGIGYGFQDDRYNSLVIKNNVSEGFEDDNRTSMENVLRLAQLPLLCEPGERYIYSMSYDVLGVVIEVVSGLRYDRYIERYILDPLEMKNSFFLVPLEEQHRLVHAYEPSVNGLIPTTYPDTTYPVMMDKQFFSGGSDLCSTAEDYAKFVSMVLHMGSFNGVRILGEDYVEMMLKKQTNLDDGGSDQGFAAWVTNEKGAAEGPMSVGSYGFGGFWDTYSWTDPSGDFVAVLLLQMYPTNEHRIHEKFQAITYRVIEEL